MALVSSCQCGARANKVCGSFYSAFEHCALLEVIEEHWYDAVSELVTTAQTQRRTRLEATEAYKTSFQNLTEILLPYSTKGKKPSQSSPWQPPSSCFSFLEEKESLFILAVWLLLFFFPLRYICNLLTSLSRSGAFGWVDYSCWGLVLPCAQQMRFPYAHTSF